MREAVVSVCFMAVGTVSFTLEAIMSQVCQAMKEVTEVQEGLLDLVFEYFSASPFL